MRANVVSSEIASIHLQTALPTWSHLYATPFLLLYPVYAYAYLVKYDDWLRSEEWTFLVTVCLLAGHALSFLVTRWSVHVKARLTSYGASNVESAQLVKVIPQAHKGEGELVPLNRRTLPDWSVETSFTYQADKYVLSPKADSDIPTFARLPYPVDQSPPISTFQSSEGLITKASIDTVYGTFGPNKFDIPVPTFVELFKEHAVAPFFVFQVFCVGLWMLDEYWYYSLFTLFMLVVFECTVVFQRIKTLGEFRSMSIKPYSIWARREGGVWKEIQTDELLPGDVVSVVRSKDDSALPADLLLLHGTTIVNEAMLSGESTPLLKESVELRDGSDHIDINGSDRNSVLFGGTKVLQSTVGENMDGLAAPDGGSLAVVLRTGFGTTQGQLIRLMVFSSERVTANNFEAFLFIGFLLIFAIAASAYVWTKGIEADRKKSKLLLDCILIITSVVPPELPMELSLAVNASLVALSKFAIFCTEPFRIPFAGRVDVCCFDKTGTITGEALVVEGVAGVNAADPKELTPVLATSKETTLTLASAHALVLLDDGVVGDPMEKTTLDALNWKLSKGDLITPAPPVAAGEGKPAPPVSKHKAQVSVRRRFQFSSALKRMSTVSFVVEGAGSGTGAKRRTFVAVKGAPETLKAMYTSAPADYDETYKWFTRRGSRVLALGYKYMDGVGGDQINHLAREKVESGLTFAGFLVFHCPLKPDAVEALKMLNDSSHRCVMITGDNPLTAAHVAKDVEIVDREVLILDLREGATRDDDLVWRTVDERKIISVNVSEPIDTTLFDTYDICITGAALKQFEDKPAWKDLVQNTWVYARVSPSQKEFILSTLKSLGYITLMAGDGTNDVGALKMANIGVALLDGSPDDLKKIAEHQRNERMKKVYESQLSLSLRFNAAPPPVPPVLAQVYPDLVKAREEALQKQNTARQRNPLEKFDMASITAKMAEMEDDDQPPQIKLGDASVAAPFTSKLSNVIAIPNIIRQGRCTLVATIQMYKILALNCLIQAYSLSVLYLDGIKFGDYQATISGMLMSVCFLCISRAKPVEKLSKERPLGNIFNFYVLLSVLLQFAIHIASLLYITNLANLFETRDPVDLEAEFKPTLLNTAIFCISLSQQVSTFAINYQGRPFREAIHENSALYYGLLACAGIAFAGSTEFSPELSRWLQLTEFPNTTFMIKLTGVMLADFGGSWAVELICKWLFADLAPKAIVTKGLERREKRRAAENLEKLTQEIEEKVNGEGENKKMK